MLLLLITSVLWGISYGVNAQALSAIPPLQMTAFFLLTGLLMFLPFARNSSVRSLRLACLGIGAVQFGLMYLFLQQAFALLEGHQVAVLCLSTPLYMALFADFLERRRNGLRWLLALATLLVSFYAVGGTSFSQISFTGAVCSQLANIFYAMGQLLYRRLKRRNLHMEDRSALFWLYLGSILVLIPFFGKFSLSEVSQISWSWWLIGELIFLGPICCGLGNYLWNKGLTRVTPSTLLIFDNAPVIFGILSGVLIFGEPFEPFRQISSAAAMGALLLLNSRLIMKSRSTSGIAANEKGKSWGKNGSCGT